MEVKCIHSDAGRSSFVKLLRFVLLVPNWEMTLRAYDGVSYRQDHRSLSTLLTGPKVDRTCSLWIE